MPTICVEQRIVEAVVNDLNSLDSSGTDWIRYNVDWRIAVWETNGMIMVWDSFRH